MTIYWVSTTGNDSAAGTATAPLKTIQKGVSKLLPGDILNIKAGTYVGFICGYDDSGDYGPIIGTKIAPITIQADPSAAIGTVILKSRDNKTQDVIDFEPANGDQNYIIIKGLTINCDPSISRAGIRIEQSTGVQILNCTITNAGSFGIFTSHTTDLLIQGCTISGTKGTNTKGHGIYVANSAIRPTVRSCSLHNNGSEGIHMNGDGSDGIGTGIVTGALIELNTIYSNVVGINCDGVQNSIFQNNICYNHSKEGMTGYQSDGLGPFKNNIIKNNTFYNNSGPQLQLTTNASGNVVTGNILLGGVASVMLDSTSLSNTFDFNAVGNKFSIDYDGGSIIAFIAWQNTGYDKNSSIVTNAIFTNISTIPYDLHTPNNTSVGAYASSIIPPADTTGPVISAIVSTATSSGVTITWITNEASDTQVNYGVTNSYGTSTTLNSTLVTNHSVIITGLNSSTVYHFSVNSRDAAGNLTTSTDNIFTTTIVINPVFQAECESADVNKDGIVNVNDLVLVSAKFNVTKINGIWTLPSV